MSIVYLNVKTIVGLETIDHLDSKNFESVKAFREEKKQLLKEYVISGGYESSPYWSQRCVKGYN